MCMRRQKQVRPQFRIDKKPGIGFPVIEEAFDRRWGIDWYELVEASLHLPPYSAPYPEVCVASAVTPSGGRLAGKYDLGMLCVAAGENAGFNALDVNWGIANEIAAEHGREMDPSRLRLGPTAAPLVFPRPLRPRRPGPWPTWSPG